MQKRERKNVKEGTAEEESQIFEPLAYYGHGVVGADSHDPVRPFSRFRFRVCREFATVSPAFAGIDLPLPRILGFLPAPLPRNLSAPSRHPRTQ